MDFNERQSRIAPLLIYEQFGKLIFVNAEQCPNAPISAYKQLGKSIDVNE